MYHIFNFSFKIRDYWIESKFVEQNVLTNKMIYRMNISKYYPVEYENFDKALQIEFNEEVDDFNASVLITNLLEWMNVFKNQKGINDVVGYLNRKFPNLTLNTLQIDLKSENCYFEGNIYEGTFSSGLKNGSGKYLYLDGCLYEGFYKK